MSEKRLGDLAREAVAQHKYEGHKTELEQARAKCRANIDKVKTGFRERLLQVAARGEEQMRLLTVSSKCVSDVSDRAHQCEMGVVCEQCIEFMNWLRSQGLTPRLAEDKHSYYIDISWKEQA